MLKVESLSVYIDNKKILENISFEVKKNEIVAIIGPNGSGKTTLVRAILNDEKYKKIGKIFFEEKDITDLPTEEIAKLGIFSVFQIIPSIETIKTKNFLKYLGISDLKEVYELAKNLNLPHNFLERGLHENFSGGERKKFELLLLKILNPKFIIFDEIDSGLDLESLEQTKKIVEEERTKGKTFLIISHYPSFLKEIKPEKVIVLLNGKILKVGDEKILDLIEKNGYNF